MITPRPHDLIWLADPRRCLAGEALPDWVSLEALGTMPVVVRRDACRPGAIPVGLRGQTRAQRFGTWIAPTDIGRIVTPMEIAARRGWRERTDLAALPAIRTLEGVAQRLDATGLRWGVTGGAGYSVASGANVLHADSDLDLVVYAARRPSDAQAGLLADLLHAGPARIDMQIDTPFGGFSLLERLRTGGRVLLKTARGPWLCADPWQPPS